jgi:hypothetical protein
MNEPNLYDIDKRVTGLEFIVKDLSEGMKTLRETTQETNSTIEKFIARQDTLNQLLTDNLNKLTDKVSEDKKELFSKISEVATIENNHYIEQIKEDKEEVKESKTNTGTWVKWIVGTIIAGLGVYSAFIK